MTTIGPLKNILRPHSHPQRPGLQSILNLQDYKEASGFMRLTIPTLARKFSSGHCNIESGATGFVAYTMQKEQSDGLMMKAFTNGRVCRIFTMQLKVNLRDVCKRNVGFFWTDNIYLGWLTRDNYTNYDPKCII